jgi:nitrite reductase/ring-hydroxylating ferredoxin subunit
MQRSMPICRTDKLPPGKTVKFIYRVDGIAREGFAANVGGRLVAYENTCKHIPVPLDYDDNRFFTPDGEHFICSTHGAVYHPLNGTCLAGPCAGAQLTKLHATKIKNEVWVKLPNDTEDPSV